MIVEWTQVTDAWRLASNVSLSWVDSECDAVFAAVDGLASRSDTFLDDIAKQAITRQATPVFAMQRGTCRIVQRYLCRLC